MQGPKQGVIDFFYNYAGIAALSRNLIWLSACCFPFLLKAQPLVGKKEQNSLRINAYASLLTGSSSGSNIAGKSGTFEFFNYHIQNVTQVYQITAGKNDYKVNSFKNEFTWHLGKVIKIHTINSFSFSPVNSYAYSVNQYQSKPNQPLQETVDRVQINSKDQYTQNGGQLSFKLKNVSLGGMFLYMNRQSFRTMHAQQYALTLETNTLRKVSVKGVLGGIQNSFFTDKMNYFETELRISLNRNIKFYFNANKGSTRMYYSLLDGGFTLFNEDVLQSIIGIKTEFNFTPYIGGFVKAEKYNFKNTNVNFFYFGFSYKIKPY